MKFWIAMGISFVLQLLALFLAYKGDQFIHVFIFVFVLLFLMIWGILNYEDTQSSD